LQYEFSYFNLDNSVDDTAEAFYKEGFAASVPTAGTEQARAL